MTFAVRTALQPASMATAMRSVLHEVDINQPPQSITTMTDLVATTTAEPQFQTRLIAIFSMLALVLAAIGVYGVLACAVAERTREIGIRMALGAEKSDITRMILRRSLHLVTIGVALGVAGALAITRVLAKVPVRSEAHRSSHVPCGSRVTRGCRAPRGPAACATRHRSGSPDRSEMGIVC
jgi:putative ABC transport system permease protein